MKKLLLIMVGMLVLYSGIYSKSINVTSPIAGSYHQSGNLDIRWTALHVKGNVEINLKKADRSGNIVLQRSYDVTRLSYSHSLAGISPGRYFVEIKQGTISGRSKEFTITLTQRIKVSLQHKKILYRGVDNINILWTTEGITGKVRIYLVKSNGSGGSIILKNREFNNSPYRWNIPSRINEGTYAIKVVQGRISGTSLPIEIKNYWHVEVTIPEDENSNKGSNKK